MNGQAVRRLTRKGCIIAKSAAEQLSERDVDLILSLDSIPMYLTVEMLEQLRENHEPDCNGYTTVTFRSSCPEFVGVDLEEYGSYEAGDTAELPGDNAEILINRGIAEPTR